MTDARSRICVALDTQDAAQAAELARKLAGTANLVKVGMELFYAAGEAGYRMVTEAGVPVFLDLKLHDIPNTVAQGLRSLMRLDPAPAIVNVHATGGPAMMRAAAQAVEGRAKLIAVTLLTSLGEEDAAAVGFDAALGIDDHVANLAELARACGLDGVVCSPRDLATVRRVCGPDFLTVVPGIRPAGAETADQKRIATPRAAQEAGADILVIGRPVTQAEDPVAAAAEIARSLAGESSTSH